eukprot:CAMPEP_0182925054 /NCGR_PEP_ID=MMETSP0105_2-20130417/8103_1 /TAXON_ID=81532 ORGANISM="Acanthoeca-like sp., Strain 10tr" /NCGR_SAMPLE_ID=MMETSP0105_2 /ASSEMBLY_ACC=CAM_ASM_000205 /LENGTH=172 /DNA_ID=CAMNT_0025062887 /DNA_START=9 /DNA_END=527 /DNA_ORIENTATION=-
MAADAGAVDVVVPIAVGAALPHAEVFDETKALVDIRTIFAKKKGILFGVPGAFTPTCSKTHLPGYVDKREELAAKGIEVVACVSVNDRHVMAEWGKVMAAEGRVRMLADQSAALSRALGVADGAYVQKLGSVRCRRFAMVINDNVVTHVKVEEPSGSGAPSCSFAPDVLSLL